MEAYFRITGAHGGLAAWMGVWHSPAQEGVA